LPPKFELQFHTQNGVTRLQLFVLPDENASEMVLFGAGFAKPDEVFQKTQALIEAYFLKQRYFGDE